MAILESLTPEESALAESIAQECILDLVVYREPDQTHVAAWLKIAYGLYDLDMPTRVEIVDSPFAAKKLARELTGVDCSLDYCGVGDGGWVSFYGFFARIGVLTTEESADVRALRDFSRSAWDTLLLDGCAIVVRRPTVLKLDDAGNLHSASGPCIEWRDGERDFAWHGQWVPERIVTDPRGHTRAEYMAISNTEERRALSEAAGWAWVADLLGAKEIDGWNDPRTNLRYTLLKCEDGQKLLAKQSPRLKGGDQPSYMEPVHEDLLTACAARKWQATTLAPKECEADPDLSYGIET